MLEQCPSLIHKILFALKQYKHTHTNFVEESTISLRRFWIKLDAVYVNTYQTKPRNKILFCIIRIFAVSACQDIPKHAHLKCWHPRILLLPSVAKSNLIFSSLYQMSVNADVRIFLLFSCNEIFQSTYGWIPFCYFHCHHNFWFSFSF